MSLPDDPLLVRWRKQEGSRVTVIRVYATAKVRLFYDHGQQQPSSDQWPVLYRSDVPNLTDEQWIESPGEGWERQRT